MPTASCSPASHLSTNIAPACDKGELLRNSDGGIVGSVGGETPSISITSMNSSSEEFEKSSVAAGLAQGIACASAKSLSLSVSDPVVARVGVNPSKLRGDRFKPGWVN